MERRFFKIIDSNTGLSQGRFTGATPKQAASKCATKLFMQNKHKGINVNNIKLCIRESTRGCSRKYHFYEVVRVKLQHPQVIHMGPQTIVYKFKNTVHKIPCFIDPLQYHKFPGLKYDMVDKPVDKVVEHEFKPILAQIECGHLVIEV